MNRKQIRQLDRCVVRLEDLQHTFSRELDRDGKPLSESIVSFNRSTVDRIQRIIDALDAIADED